jgi:hypothetical protein
LEVKTREPSAPGELLRPPDGQQVATANDISTDHSLRLPTVGR